MRKDILDIYPELKESNPEVVNRNWATLRRLAPTICAKDINIAGAWLRQLVEVARLGCSTEMVQRIMENELTFRTIHGQAGDEAEEALERARAAMVHYPEQ